MAIGRLLNIKDNISQQINQAVSYQKLVCWADLNIKLQGKENDDIYDHSKAVDLHNKISDFM
jgi:hypothetical protein